MYCVKCGVGLADSEKACPLCGTVVYHPDLPRQEGQPLYPQDRTPALQVSQRTALMVLTTLCFLLPMVICWLCDRQANGRVDWSGYVMGGLAIVYIMFLLPAWFRRPNPVIFVPCTFAAAIAFLLYIDLSLEGQWFLGFAFPVAGGVGLIVTAVTALLKYVKKGQLYVFGGAFLALAAFMPVVELLANLTFGLHDSLVWSGYPTTALGFLGAGLLFLAICRPARETMERKFFL